MIRDKLCKKCRRAGVKLFLKGERCNSPKCAMVKRNFPPGIHGQKGYPRLSSYGTHMREKQKVRFIYGVTERQLSNYMKKALKKRGDTGETFLQQLERRFDNVVYRLGLARSRAEGRRLISHGHFMISDKTVTIPSRLLKENEEIMIKPKSLTNKYFLDIIKSQEKSQPPSWLAFDRESLKAKIIHLPIAKELDLGIETQLIVEYYSL
jgi:small subunit ribosomal protein S4